MIEKEPSNLATICRSFLFVPGDRPDLVAKAAKGFANAVCIDLEDGVAASAKSTARHMLNDNLHTIMDAGFKAYVRINPTCDVANHEQDLAALTLRPDGIVLPKTKGWEQVAGVVASFKHNQISGPEIIAMVEDPKALLAFEQGIAACDGIEALLLGVEDFGACCGCAPDAPLIRAAYLRMVIAAKAVGIKAYGMPCGISEYRKFETFQEAACFAKTAGGDGAFAIHPDQVNILLDVFSVTAEEASWAHSVIDVFEKARVNGQAIAALNGQMIDQPVYARACKLLKRKLPLT